MEYKHLYHILFNSITDAIAYMDEGRYELARLQLVLAQIKTEEEYIRSEET